MNLTDTVATILAILALTAGTGVFVAAEFSLTALDRSTVEANARGGTSRDRFIQRAHHRLSFQLSGAQLGISYLDHHLGYRLPDRTAGGRATASWAGRSRNV